MQKVSLKNSVLMAGVFLAALVFALILATAAPANAQEAQTPVQDQRDTAQERKEAAQQKAAEKKDAAKEKLDDNKLKSCQKREAAINNILARISDRGTKQIEVFNKISERTQTFYNDKGRTLSTYEALVADAAAKQVDAEAAVAAVKDTSVTFKCDGTDPKGAAASFKDSLKAQNEALKAYKTSVKNLIVGVKSVQSTTNSDEEQNQGEGQ